MAEVPEIEEAVLAGAERQGSQPAGNCLHGI